MRIVLGLLLFAASTSSFAQDLTEQLVSSLEELTGAQMDFDQKLTDSANQISFSVGRLNFQRPKQFKVSYFSPYRIDMISNGDMVWFHDHDLNQVVISGQATAYGSRGLITVLSTTDLDTLFTVSSRSDSITGIDWLVLKPLAPEELELIHCEVGFDSSGNLVAVNIDDLLGNQIEASFTDLRVIDNPSSLFEFVPPHGAEIIQQ